MPGRPRAWRTEDRAARVERGATTVRESGISRGGEDHHGRTYLGSVEVGDTVLMFEARDRLAPSAAKPGTGCGIRLTILLPQGHDIDAYYSELLAKNVPIACEIGNRFWGNRDFTISDPDEYHLTLAKQIRA